MTKDKIPRTEHARPSGGGLKRRDLLLSGTSLLVATAVSSSGLTAVDAQQASRPNIVIILADDLGNADLGYHGSDIKTPNIDKLAKDGVRMKSFYGMPVCTPSRAELMTGRYAMRYGLQTLVIFPSHTFRPGNRRTHAAPGVEGRRL